MIRKYYAVEEFITKESVVKMAEEIAKAIALMPTEDGKEIARKALEGIERTADTWQIHRPKLTYHEALKAFKEALKEMPEGTALRIAEVEGQIGKDGYIATSYQVLRTLKTGYAGSQIKEA